MLVLVYSTRLVLPGMIRSVWGTDGVPARGRQPHRHSPSLKGSTTTGPSSSHLSDLCSTSSSRTRSATGLASFSAGGHTGVEARVAARARPSAAQTTCTRACAVGTGRIRHHARSGRPRPAPSAMSQAMRACRKSAQALQIDVKVAPGWREGTRVRAQRRGTSARTGHSRTSYSSPPTTHGPVRWGQDAHTCTARSPVCLIHTSIARSR